MYVDMSLTLGNIMPIFSINFVAKEFTKNMSTSFLGLEITQLNVARGLCGALGVLGGTMGLRGMVDSAASATIFGVPKVSPFAADKNPYISIAGGSRLASGIGTLLCLYFGQHRALGLMMMSGFLVAINDGLCLRSEVVRLREEEKIDAEDAEMAEGKAWGHLFFGPITFALGTWLYYIA